MPKINDLTGMRFGRLVAVRPIEERRRGNIVWECKCDCGKITFVEAHELRRGHTKSCGCVNQAVDLTGRRFGRLVAIRPTDERKWESVVWECKCDCGQTAFVAAKLLRSGDMKTCGCVKPKPGNKAVDLTGQRFGRLTALRPTEERRRKAVVWECKCDCGQTAFVSANLLRTGHTKSCGCIARGKGAADLTGQRFGRLTALRPTEERQNGSVVWECKCDCGQTAFVAANILRAGNMKSCGCVTRGRKAVDLTGQRFGQLAVLRPTDERKYGSVVWECKCDCGNIVFVAATSLRAGETKSCGCAKIVSGDF